MRALKGVILNEVDVKKLSVENYELKLITSTKVFLFVAQVLIL